MGSSCFPFHLYLSCSYLPVHMHALHLYVVLSSRKTNPLPVVSTTWLCQESGLSFPNFPYQGYNVSDHVAPFYEKEDWTEHSPNTKHPCCDCLDLQPTQRSDCAIACTTSLHQSLYRLASSAPSHVYSCYRESRSTTNSAFRLLEEWQFSFPKSASGCTALSSKSSSFSAEPHHVPPSALLFHKRLPTDFSWSPLHTREFFFRSRRADHDSHRFDVGPFCLKEFSSHIALLNCNTAAGSFHCSSVG